MRFSLIIIFSLSSYFTFSQKSVVVDEETTAAFVSPNYASQQEYNSNGNVTKSDIGLSSGALFFDATKRMGYFNLVRQDDGTYIFKYIAEEQPDAIFATLKDFFAKLGGKKGDDFKINAEVKSVVNKSIEKLTNKSNSLNHLRTALYRLNEASFNGDINKDDYKDMFMAALKSAKDIELKELSVNKGTIEENVKSDETEEDESKGSENKKETKDLESKKGTKDSQGKKEIKDSKKKKENGQS